MKLYIASCLFLMININLVHSQDAKSWSEWQDISSFPSKAISCQDNSYELVFSDEFNDNSIDTKKWFTYSPDGCPNSTDQCAWARARDAECILLDENIVLNNGMLEIWGKAEEAEWFGEKKDYTAGMIWTKLNHKFLYGKFEARIKVPEGSGLWPAFWLWSGSEIDIIEFPGKSPLKYMINTHNGGKQNPRFIRNKPVKKINYTNDFHIYAVEWSEHKIDWFIDGQRVRTMYRYEYKKNGTRYKVNCEKAESDIYIENPKGQYRINTLMADNRLGVILNLAIIDNKNFSGIIDKSIFPVKMEVDYVRVYQRKP